MVSRVISFFNEGKRLLTDVRSREYPLRKNSCNQVNVILLGLDAH